MKENSQQPTHQTANTIASWIKRATDELKSANIPSARLDSELILGHTIRRNRSYLHAHPDEELSGRQIEIADARINLRLDRVPVAYIIGHKEFYGNRFKVTTATLIPRPESEELIELLNEAVPKNEVLLKDERLRLVDVGTGSGILGITAKKLYPEIDVHLLDISQYALKIAQENARSLDVDVDTSVSNLLDNYPFDADIIVANLPYVDESWDRSPETNHEPSEALFADHGGLELIFKLIDQTAWKLRQNGFLILEADPDQHKAIIDKAKTSGLLLQSKKTYGLLLQKIA